MNITPNNIVRIYVKSPDDTVATEELSKFTEDDFVVADTVTPPNPQQHGPMSPAALSISSATPDVLYSLPCTPNSSSVVQSFTPRASGQNSVSHDYMSQTPGKQYTPVCNRTVLQSPACNRAMPQSTVCNRIMPQSPFCNRTVPQSPSCNRTVPQPPACNRTVLQSPTCNRTVPQSTVCNRIMPQLPACNRTVPKSPVCNRTMPQPVSRFNFKKPQTSSPHHPSDADNTVGNLHCSSSVTDHFGNGE